MMVLNHNFDVEYWTPHISYKQILVVTYTLGHVLLNCRADFLINTWLSKYLHLKITSNSTENKYIKIFSLS